VFLESRTEYNRVTKVRAGIGRLSRRLDPVVKAIMTSTRPLTAFVNPPSTRKWNGQRPSADPIARLEYEHRFARCLDGVSSSETGKSRSDDAHIN
jgi:hypothetical protein